MKKVPNTFKSAIKTNGRYLDTEITFGDTTLGKENLNSVNISFNSSLFKTVMRTIEIDSNVEIPKDTIINVKSGVYTTTLYQYVNYGNYKVTNCEVQEDTISYKITAYDKMIESMIDLNLDNVSYPISIKNFLIKIFEKLNWNYSLPESFPNANRNINSDLFSNANMTFRDLLDELATITGSFIYFDNDIVCLSQGEETNETIDSEYMKDSNVTVGEKVFFNSLVFSRAEDSDTIYRKDQENIDENGLHEFKISDLQILSTNDRDLYIDELWQYLKTFEYYSFDIETYGIMFMDIADKFKLSIRDNFYNSILLNDEISITQGLSETIYSDAPEETETDYKYSDETDKKINQTYLIVDKQNQKITSLTNEVNQYDNRITTVEQSVDGLTQIVEAGYDFVRTASGNGDVQIMDAVTGNLLYLKITGEVSILPNTYTYPSNNLFPHDALYLLIEGEEESKRTKLPFFSLHTYNGHNDEFILEDGKAKLIRKIGINSDDSRYLLETESVIEYGDFNVELYDGNNKISMVDFSSLNYETRYAVHNEITDQFATKAELSSSITQTENEINLEVSKKVDEDKIISSINQSAEEIKIKANKISLEGYTTINEGFSVDEDGKMSCVDANIIGGNIQLSDDGSDGRSRFVLQEEQNSKETNIFSDMYTIDTQNFRIMLGTSTDDGNARIDISNVNSNSGFYASVNDSSTDLNVFSGDSGKHIQLLSDGLGDGNPTILVVGGSSSTSITQNGIWSPSINNTSTKDVKKNIKKFKTNALNLIKSTDLYNYNYKNEKSGTKKHIGIVIGDGYNYPREILSTDGNGVDLYSMISVCFKAIQEQQEKIEDLQNQINKLKGSDK